MDKRDEKKIERWISKFKKSWDKISKYPNLSEDFIREYSDYVNWNSISRYQKLSENFIREFRDKVNWGLVVCGQDISYYFFREFQNNIEESIKKRYPLKGE